MDFIGLRFTDSDYTHGIFKIFLNLNCTNRSWFLVYTMILQHNKGYKLIVLFVRVIIFIIKNQESIQLDNITNLINIQLMKLNCTSEGIWRQHCLENILKRTKEMRHRIFEGTVLQIVTCSVLFAPPNVFYDNMKTYLTLLHTLHTGFSDVRVARSLVSCIMFWRLLFVLL